MDLCGTFFSFLFLSFSDEENDGLKSALTLSALACLGGFWSPPQPMHVCLRVLVVDVRVMLQFHRFPEGSHLE
jgi:hypothetical protein